jgi:hypothetical protein
MADDQDIVLPFQLHDHRFQPDHHIPVTLSASVSVVELVLVSRLVVLGVFLLNLLVCHAIADTRIELV